MTEYHRPATLDEALQLRRAHPDFVVLAGGTDLLVASKNSEGPPGVVDIFGIEDLVGVREQAGDVHVGAATTYREILASDLVHDRLPALAAAAREVGALQIQSRGTIGGNMATSSPVGDTLPVLLALDARVVLASASGSREIPYDEFCTGYRTTAAKSDELIVAVRFPALPEGTAQFWRKMGTRRAQSISKVMVAATARVAGGTFAHIRVGLGAVAETPIRAAEAEAAVLGKAPTVETAEAARAAVLEATRPIDDLRSTASYRANAAGNVVRRFLLSFVQG